MRSMLAEIQAAIDAAGLVSLYPGAPHMCEVEGETAGSGAHRPTRGTPAFHRDCARCTIAVHATAMRRPTAMLLMTRIDGRLVMAGEHMNDRILAAGLPLPLVPEPRP